jgi:probable selenium-dependent hydroxylase accessory protein YqeC
MTRCRTLADALGIERGEVVAFVGGGGKTGAILRLTEELRLRGWRVVASTTTRVGRSVEASLPVLAPPARASGRELDQALERHGAVFLAGTLSAGGKIRGVDPLDLDGLPDGLADAILIEADGARQMPIKAPADHEPVVPSSTTLVVPMVGLDALGRAMEPSRVHRAEILSAVVGQDTVTPDAIVRLITSADGGMKAVPRSARVRPVLNKVRPETRRAAAGIARALLVEGPASLDRVVVSDVASGDFTYAGRAGG